MPSISTRAFADGVGEIMIYDMIGDLGGGHVGISAKEFDAALRAIAPATVLNLRINSPGGSTVDTAAILAMLGRWRLSVNGRIIAYIDGMAVSAASWLAMVADEVIIAPDAMMMIHRSATSNGGKAHELRNTASQLDRVDASMAADYAAHTGQSIEQIEMWMSGETWFSAEEAVRYGFADRVEGEPMRLAALGQLDSFHYKHPPISIAKMATDYWAARRPLTRPAASAKDIWSKWNAPTALKRGSK